MNTWKSLRVLDTIYDSILGRSGSLPAGMDEHQLRRVGQASGYSIGPRQTALQATYDVCPFLDELEQKHCIQSISATEDFLQRLQQWSKALPAELRQSTQAEALVSTTTDRELLIGGTHVACTYYFAVILATRRFLTLYLLDQLKERSPTSLEAPAQQLDEKTSSLAFVCLNAAISLTEAVSNVIMNDSALRNMCLVK